MDPLRTTVAPETRLHFLDYWRIIRIRKAVIILVFLLVSITATFVTFLLPKAYSSSARIRVNRDTTDVPSMNGMPAMTGYDPFFIQTEFAVIQSEVILDKVIERPDLDLNKAFSDKLHRTTPLKTSETRQMLKGMLELTPVRNTSLIEIKAYSDDYNEAAKIAQAVAETYQQYRREQWENSLPTASPFLTGKWRITRRNHQRGGGGGPAPPGIESRGHGSPKFQPRTNSGTVDHHVVQQPED